jgi:hypothetical protein
MSETPLPIRFVIFVGETPIEIDLKQMSPTMRLGFRDLAAEARLLVSALPPSCSGSVPMLPQRT